MIRGGRWTLAVLGLAAAPLVLTAACANPKPAPVVYKGSVPGASPSATAARPAKPAVASAARGPSSTADRRSGIARKRAPSAPEHKTEHRLSRAGAPPAARAPIEVKPIEVRPIEVSELPPAGAPAPRQAARSAAPAAGSAVYVVRPGDTIYSVSRAFGIDTYELAKLNGIKTPFRIAVGQELRLAAAAEGPAEPSRQPAVAQADAPRAGAPVPPSRPLPEPAASADAPPRPAVALADPMHGAAPWPSSKPPVEQVAMGPGPAPAERPVAAASNAEATPAAMVRPPTPPARAGMDFAWPVHGSIVSQYGPKPGGLHNDGINIGAPAGTPVRAAENGVVAYVGNELKGFGSMLLIRHADGWITAYAHNQEVLVRVGDVVRRGQVVAKVGSTGNAPSPQLHFELRKGATAVDPLRHLVPQPALTSALAPSSSAPGGGRRDPG